jgi:hypothetical protein
LDKFEGALQTHGLRKMIKAHGKSTASGSGAAAIRNSKVGGGAFCLVVRTSIEDMLDEAKGMINAITGQ